MFKQLWQLIKKYAGLVDDIFVDFLSDLKSLRYQLILWAYIFNFAILYLVFIGKTDYKLSGIGIALLTAVYTFFFASKHVENQNKLNQQAPAEEEDEKAGDANEQ